MNYQVISRKYRPQNFDEIIGQDHIRTTLQNALESGRIAHAYLFTGSRGVGKTSTARILAKTLNCLEPQGLNPCNSCQNCVEITNSRSLDVMEIDGASNRGIDQVRDLRENVKYPPSNSKYRIFIIDEVHMLTREAFNALLKTLEEPPPQVVFIFATTEPLKVPPTIISRCQRFDFHRIPVQQIVEQLRKIVKAEKLSISDEILTLLAKKSDGAMRDSESLLEQVISFSSENVTLSLIQKLLGLTDYEYYFNIGKLILNHDLNALINVAEEVFNNGLNIGEFLIGLSEHFRNLLVTAISKSATELDLPDSLKSRYVNEAPQWSINDLMRLVKLIGDAQIGLKTTLNQRTHLEFTLLRMGSMEKTVTIQSILQNIGNRPIVSYNPPKAASKTVEMFSPKPAPIASPPKPIENTIKEPVPEKLTPPVNSSVEPENQATVGALSLDIIREQWPTILHKIEEGNQSLANFLYFATPMQLNGNILDIGLTEEQEASKKIYINRFSVIEKIISEMFNKSVKVRCVRADGADKSAVPQKKPIDKMTATVVDLFDGEIIIT